MDETQGDKSRQATTKSCMIRQREIKRAPIMATAQSGGGIRLKVYSKLGRMCSAISRIV